MYYKKTVQQCIHVPLKPLINLASAIHKLFSHVFHNSKKARYPLHLILHTHLVISNICHNVSENITHCRRWFSVLYKQV